MAVPVRLLGPEDAALVLAAEDVFDSPADPGLTTAFLADARHHILGAIAEGRLVGIASGCDYIHPDKPPSLWINEVGVADAWARRGIGLALTRAMLDHARGLGCREAWLLTEGDNLPARGLYAKAGGVPHGSDPVMYTFDLAAGEGDAPAG